MNIKDEIITLYHNKLKLTPLFKDMEAVFENSPWHRESNVLIHTDMVFSQYISNNINLNKWALGALACIFHDVGKPSSIEYKNSEERGDYKSFPNHELKSARLWEDFAVTNWDIFKKIITPSDICNISWLIENHLPYKFKKDHKLNNLFYHNITALDGIFKNVLLADSNGRISDNHDEKKSNVNAWINDFETNQELINFSIEYNSRLNNLKNNPKLYMLIGASGSGKSTFSKKICNYDDTNYYSLDKIRLDLYSNNYSEAYDLSCKDSNFISKSQKIFMNMLKTNKNIIIDNTNISRKRRKFYLEHAFRHNYELIAVIFPSSLKTLINRQLIRDDKIIPEDIVIKQYMNIQQPSLGEFDKIIYHYGNIF